MYTDHVTCTDRVTCTVPFQALRPALPSCCLPQAAPRTGPSASPPTTATTATRSSSSTALRPSGSQMASFPSARRSRSRSPCGCGTGPWAGRRRRSCAVRTERVSVAGKARHFGVHWSGCWGRAPCSSRGGPRGPAGLRPLSRVEPRGVLRLQGDRPGLWTFVRFTQWIGPCVSVKTQMHRF